MKQTEAQLKAAKKYSEKFDKVQFRAPQGFRKEIANHAELMNESMNSFINRAILEAIERDKQKSKD